MVEPSLQTHHEGALPGNSWVVAELSCTVELPSMLCDGKCCSCFVVGFAMFSVNRQVEVTIVHFGAIFCPWSDKNIYGLGSLDSWICRTVAQELRSLPM